MIPATEILSDELSDLIALVNKVMAQPVDGLTLRLWSPSDLDAPRDGTAPLPPGVRRISMVIDNPAGWLDPRYVEGCRLVFWLYVVGSGPNIQLDAETLLRWAVQIENTAGFAEDTSRDVADPPTLRALAKDRLARRDISQALARASHRANAVADDVRASVGDPSTWLPISPSDSVRAVATLHRIPSSEEFQ